MALATKEGRGAFLTGNHDYSKDKNEKNLKDYFGLNLSDGDRYGEIIPSMFAWMPPDEQRRRVEEMLEMSSDVGSKYESYGAKEGQGLAKKKKKKQVIDSAKERSIEEAKIYETMRPQVDDDPDPHK